MDGLAGFPDIYHVRESNNVEVVILMEVTQYDMHGLLGLEDRRGVGRGAKFGTKARVLFHIEYPAQGQEPEKKFK